MTIQPLTGNRETWWEWSLLDLNDHVIDTLSGVREGSSSLELNVNAPTRVAGSMTWIGLAEEMREWTRYHLQPTLVERDNDTGLEHRSPLGVFLPTSPSAQYSETSAITVPIGLYDKSLILREDEIPTDIAYPAGTNPVDAITEQIRLAAGEQAQIAIEYTGETLRTSMFWSLGTTRLRIVNDLLKAMGYFAIYVDYAGVFTSSPYVRPIDRPEVYTFEAGPKSIYLPTHTMERDTFKVPNQLILISQSDADTEGLQAIATNENPEHPYSYQRRGRWISRTIADVEATSQEVLNSEAERRLAEMSSVATNAEVTHAPVITQGHDRVRLERPRINLYFDGTVQAMTMKDSGRWTTNLREVLPGLTEEVFEE